MTYRLIFLTKGTLKMKKKENRGGKREGSGAPLKYGEKTMLFQKTVPISQYNTISEMVESYLLTFVKKQNNINTKNN